MALKLVKMQKKWYNAAIKYLEREIIMTETKKSLMKQLWLPAIFCAALWGSAAPCIKAGYKMFSIASGESCSQLVFAGLRLLFAGLSVLAAAWLKKKRIIPHKDEWRPIFLISLFQSMIQYVFYYIGLSATTGTKGAVLSGTQSFFALLFAHIFLKNDKLTRRKALGCLCGFAGVLVLGMGGINGFSFPGDLLVLLSAVSSGAGALVSRIYTPGRDPMLLTGWQLAIGGAFLLAVGITGGGRLNKVTFSGILLLGYMVLLSAAAFTIWTALLGKFPVGKVALFSFLIPVFGALISALVLNEHVFTLRNLAALALVSGGIAVTNISPSASDYK